MKKNPNILKMAVYAVILIGVFTGLLETASASANINVADNGHYFEYDGQQEFLVGLGSWTPINHNDFDYTAHNQWYQSYGINYNRITLTSTWYTDHSKQVFPWKRSTTPGANDGGNKFDLNDWDPVFWDRLKGYLQDCKDRGITVCIQFFDECSVEAGSKRWNQHPFNPQNNINNIPDLDTTDASYSSSTEWSKSFYNVDNSVLMTLQDIYVQKLLDETSQYGNIIYEMANEYGGEGSTQYPGHLAWPQHWIDFFSNYESTNGVQLLLTNMPFGGSYNQAEYFAASGIDCIDAYRQFPSYSDGQGVNDFLGAHYNKGKPIFAGKIGNDVGEERGNVNDNRKRLWTLLVSGGAGSGIKGSCWGIVDWTDDTTMEEMVLNIHIFIDAGIGFWNMVPKDSLVTSGTAYCLANPGNEYVVYLPEGGSVTVDLSGATGTLNVEWYDPKEGTYTDGGTVTGGGNETFTPLFSGDVVLHILLSTGVNHAPVAQDQSVTTDEDTARAITLVATDVDGDTLTYSIVTQPSHGTLSGIPPDVTYTPDANYNGSDSFSFKANDGTADSNVAAVSITVTSVNDASVAQDQSVTTDEDTARAITLVATDVDDDTLTYSIVTQPLHGTLSGAAPNVTYTPDADYHGSDSFTFMANDGLLDSNVATVSITVTSVNDASVAQDQSVTTDEDTARAITLVATDVDDDTLTYSIVTQPLHGTLSGAAPNVTYTPDADYHGSDSFTFMANDGLLDSNVATVSITVTSVNDAPVAQDQSVTTDEDTPKAITLVATDVDGDTLTYSIVTQPSHGTLSGAAPNMTYTPDADYHGSDSFTFMANDGLLDSNVATVSITVTSVNDAPVAQDQSVTTDEDTPKAITLVATDVDGDTLTYSIVTQPSHGTLSGAAPNMTYTPDADYHGSDSFTFRANDGLLDSNVAAVSITVTSVNDASVAQDQSVTTDEDTPKAITLVATDVDGDTLTYSIVTQPLHGTLSGAAPNMTYTPDANYNGSDSFTFKANDALLDSNVATVFITVGSELIISNLIVASGKSYEVVYSGLVEGAFQYIDRSYTFSAIPILIDGATYIKTANNDKNRAEREFLSFDVNQAVTIYVAHDDRIVPRPSWLHDFVDTGEDLLSDDLESEGFRLFKKDFPQGTISLGGNIDSSIPADTKRSMYTVVIVGNGSNHPPVADPNGPYTGTEGVPIAYDGNGSYDPDGTIVSYLWSFGDGNNATGVTPTHIYAQDGTYNVTLTVTDNDGATDTSITTATIADTEPIADFSATPTSGQESLTVTFSDNSTSYDGIEAWNWDFDNDGVTDSNVQNPTHVYAEEGVYTVSLKVNESDGDSETMTKTDYIGVTKVNKAPFTPANPSPYDGATDVPIDAVLSWTGGDPDAEDTVTYDVYFGTNTSPPQVAGNQLETTYDPGTRDNSTGYYWQIVATDNHGASNESEVWSFTTTAVPAPETIPPLVSNPSANPDVIPDDTDNDPRWGETSQINVTVTDDSGVLSVTINLSAIGGSPTQSLTSIPDTNIWTVSTNASAGTAPGNYHLKINATDTNRNSNTSVSVELRVMKNGDIDGDGTVTHDDSEYLANYLTKIPGYGEIEEVVADVDEQVDECVTIADYEYLKNHISGEPGYEKLH